MNTPVLDDQLIERMQACLKAARQIADAAEEEGRDFTDAERAEIQAKLTEAQELKSQVDKARAKAEKTRADEQIRAAIADLGDGIALNHPQKDRPAPPGLIVPDGTTSIGQHFVASKAYGDLLATAPNGQFNEKARVQSAPVGYKTLITGASDTSAGAFVQTDWRGLQVGLDAYQRPLRLRDVVSPGTTTSDTIEYARITSVSNAAAPVPEAAETAGSSGIKPESGFTTARITTPVRTIAHWVPVTKRALSDAAQIRTLIDNFLAYGLEEELEDQMVSGDGTGENLEGLAHVPGIQTQPFEEDLHVTTRRAKTKVRLVGRAVANAYLLHPADWEAIDLLTDNEGRYYNGGPGQAGPMTLWNLPVIECEAIGQGTAYVADWRMAVLWDREQAAVTATDTHADFFIRNMVAILAEMRAAFGVIRPAAFVRIDLTPK